MPNENQKPEENAGAGDQIQPEPLKEQDQQTGDKKPLQKKHLSKSQRFVDWYKDNKKKSVPLTILLLLLFLAVLPMSRYTAAGLVLKKDFSLQVFDTKTISPVSGATVSLGAVSTTTDAN